MKEIKVKSCNDCIFCDRYFWHCIHPDGPDGDLLYEPFIHPDCPLRQQAVVVGIDESQIPTT